MAKLGEIQVADRDSLFGSGAAFLLMRPSPISETVVLTDDVEVEVQTDHPYVVVRFTNVAAEDPFRLGYELVQRGLDILSVTGKADLSVRHPSDEYLVWWRSGTVQVLRAVCVITLRASVEPPKLIIMDEAGRERIFEPPSYTHHPAFRFFRLSQLTDDLHDAFRNMYLAFELLLSTKFPKGKEQEISWLERALNGADAELGLKALFPESNKSMAQTFIDQVYKNARLPLFHAKAGRDYYPPQSALEDRRAVSEALHLLTHVVLRMVEAWHETRRSGGAVFPGWIYRNMEHILSNSMMVISSEENWNQAEHDLTHSRFREGAKTSVELLPARSANEGPVVLGQASSKDLDHLSVIRLVDIIGEKSPIMSHLIEAPLTVHGLDLFECEFRTRVANVRQPKTLFQW